MQTQHAEVGKVQSMRDFVADTLRSADEINDQFQKSRTGLRERLYALDLASDAECHDRQELLMKVLSNGDQPDDLMTVKDFRASRGL
jgi:hypothetical protein